jgi:hypothetical protein
LKLKISSEKMRSLPKRTAKGAFSEAMRKLVYRLRVLGPLPLSMHHLTFRITLEDSKISPVKV